MKIKILDKTFNVDSKVQNKFISKSTKNELKEVYITFKLQGQSSYEKFLKMLDDAKDEGIIELDENNNEIACYKVGNTSYAYQGNEEDENTIYNVGLSCEQYEKIDVEKIIVEGLEFDCLNYEEHDYTQNNALVFVSTLRLSKEQNKEWLLRLKDKKYFEVVRVGIDESPLLMRTGLVINSEHDGYMKKKVNFVESCYDNPKEKRFFDEKYAVQEELAKEICFRKELVNLLMEKSVISKSEVEKLDELVNDKYTDIMRNFYLVDDVDNYN